ncbi:MAG: hypothetical protein KDA59_02630 [Planctomycetales bacterium]|nr:hypothetical protein [Planctomycetales bacterium]
MLTGANPWRRSSTAWRARVAATRHECGREVHVYGLGRRKTEGRLRFLPLSDLSFPADMAACEAVVGAAGNQTIGEALYLGKPFFAWPETRHFEQRINAFMLQRMGCGRFELLEQVRQEQLPSFIAELGLHREHIARQTHLRNAVPTTVEVITRHLPIPARTRICHAAVG